jgi:hypothetical protein
MKSKSEEATTLTIRIFSNWSIASSSSLDSHGNLIG